MNNTAAATGFQNSYSVGAFGYGIAISIGILLIIVTMTLASYCCARNTTTTYLSRPRNRRQPAAPQFEDPENCVVEVGLDEATISSYPKMLFSEAKINHNDSTAASCSICLADYKNSDVLRVLPDCGHLFHLKCVDPWLRSHPTCPVCRASPWAEVVPLAALPIG